MISDDSPYGVIREWGEGWQESSESLHYVEYLELVSDFRRLAYSFDRVALDLKVVED